MVMTNDMTTAERSYSKAIDDIMMLEPVVLEQIAALLEGKTITVEGKELVLKIGTWRQNNWESPKMTIEVLSLTDEVEKLRFSLERQKSDLKLAV